MLFGYLEKVRQPYNQLKLLETSVIIYRIVRAPERLVFKIDVGQMPRDKGMKFVEKVKQNMQKKLSYDPSTGKMTEQPDVMCIRKNTQIPLLDGRLLSLEELVKEYSEGKENWVYSINNNTLNIEPGKIINAKITRLNEKLARVYLDDGSFVETTLDHKFMTRDGKYIRADELLSGQELMPLYKREGQLYRGKSKFKDKKTSVYDPYLAQKILTKYMELGKPTRNVFISYLHNDKDLIMYATKLNEGKNLNNNFDLKKFPISIMSNVIFEMGYKNFGDFRKNYNGEIYNLYKNHKVLKVEILDYRDDTGCLEVEGNHNFAIKAENSEQSYIFVKNSILENYFLPITSDRKRVKYWNSWRKSKWIFRIRWYLLFPKKII